MQNSGVKGSGCGSGCGSVTGAWIGDAGAARAEDVISKLKEDGDFDRLRLKIIRKFKEKDEFRENIISVVKQSVTLNSPGAENMKPRQLSDAIYKEIGEKLMSQVSDGIWHVIKSTDGMKTEITETVRSVYSKMFNLQGHIGGSSSHIISHPSELETNRDIVASAREVNGTPSDGDPNEPPGFGLGGLQESNKKTLSENQNENCSSPPSRKRKANKEINEENLPSKDLSEQDNVVSSVISSTHEHSCNACDEDPDVPPGFG